MMMMMMMRRRRRRRRKIAAITIALNGAMSRFYSQGITPKSDSVTHALVGSFTQTHFNIHLNEKHVWHIWTGTTTQYQGTPLQPILKRTGKLTDPFAGNLQAGPKLSKRKLSDHLILKGFSLLLYWVRLLLETTSRRRR